MSDLVVIARQRVSDRLTSHWVGCERDHVECLIQRMADEIERLTQERDAARRDALEEAEDACNSRYKLSGRVEALACAAAIRALIEKENSDAT